MAPTDLIIMPELSYKKVAFVNNGCDRHVRNKTVLKSHCTAVTPFLSSLPADGAWVASMCSKARGSLQHGGGGGGGGTGSGCSVLYYVLWFEFSVYTESITTSGDKESSLADFFIFNFF